MHCTSCVVNIENILKEEMGQMALRNSRIINDYNGLRRDF